MVTDHILSNIERYKLRRYLEENITFNDFAPLMHILKHGAKQIKEDHHDGDNHTDDFAYAPAARNASA